jgi:ligand-binding sensor domain-containing protein
MNRNTRAALCLTLVSLFPSTAEGAESDPSCFFQKSPRIAEITTRGGHHVELFEGQIAIDGRRDDACHGLPEAHPTAIAAYRDGFAIAFRDGPVEYWEGGSYAPLPGAPGGLVRALASQGDALYIGTESGLFRWRDLGDVAPVLASELGGAAVSALATEDDGTTLVGTDEKGLWAISSDGARTEQRRRSAVGCFRRQQGRFAAEPPGHSCSAPAFAGTLPSAHVTALAVHENRVTVGTFDRGVFTVDARGTATTLKDSPLHVNTLGVSGATLFIGAANGFFAASGDDGVARISLGTPEPHVNDLTVSRDGSVWLATNHGLFSWSEGALSQLDIADGLPSSLVYSVAESDDGSVWAGTARGLYRLHGARSEVFGTANGKLPHDWVTAVVADGAAVYAGTYNAGVVRIDAKGDSAKIRSFESAWINPHGLLRLDGALFAATAGGGLFSVDGKAEPHLPSSDVTAALEHDGALWVGTRQGCCEGLTSNARTRRFPARSWADRSERARPDREIR